MNAKKNMLYMAFHQQDKTHEGGLLAEVNDFQVSGILGPDHRAGCEDKKSCGIGSMKETTTKNVEIKIIKTHIKIQLF